MNSGTIDFYYAEYVFILLTMAVVYVSMLAREFLNLIIVIRLFSSIKLLNCQYFGSNAQNLCVWADYLIGYGTIYKLREKFIAGFVVFDFKNELLIPLFWEALV